MLPVGVAHALPRAAPVCAASPRGCADAILALYGVRVRVHADAAAVPRTQTVYISNHTSTLDLFVLVALGLPNCRFFLSGFLRKFVPLGIIAWMMGTFFTVPQDRPGRAAPHLSARAAAMLSRTGESVYLSPEGGRITTGDIGHFNKGAFHLATDLRVPIVPMYFRIPPRDRSRPRVSRRARHGGRLRAAADRHHRLDAKPTWSRTRSASATLFVRAHEELRCA